MAKKVAALFIRIANHAVHTGDIPSHSFHDLVQALPKATSKKPRPAVNPNQVSDLLQSVSKYDGDELTRAALRVLFWTCLRSNELLESRWEWIEGDVLTVPAQFMKGEITKRKAHSVQLPKQALALLSDLKRSPSGFIFSSIDRPKQKTSQEMRCYSAFIEWDTEVTVRPWDKDNLQNKHD